MNQTKLLVSCTEYFSFLKNIPPRDVFQSFTRSGLIPTILDTHATFPEADLTFYMGMIDGIMALENDADESPYKNYEARIRLLNAVLLKLGTAKRCTAADACTLYYTSALGHLVSDETNGYYEKSVDEILQLLQEELDSKA